MKHTKKFISLLLSITFICSSAIPISAAPSNSNTEDINENTSENAGSCDFGDTIIQTDIIHPSDCITEIENDGSSIMPLADSEPVKKGRINYRAAIDTGLVNYGMKCSFTKSDPIKTTYTINSLTVACKKRTFKWELININDPAHKTTCKGYKYHVIDDIYHTNENYYEGFVPKDWGTQALAVLFHDKLFGYTSYSVVSWRKY